MAEKSETATRGVLSQTTSARTHVDMKRLARHVVLAGGPNPLRQTLELLWLKHGPAKGVALDYFRFGLWKHGVTARSLRNFVLPSHRRPYNFALHRPGFQADVDACTDKLETERRLAASGLPVMKTRAVYDVAGARPPYTSVLTSREEVDAYLSDPAHFPMFLKPHNRSFAIGTAGLDRIEGDEIVLTNGQRTTASSLADEIAGSGFGYLFMDLGRLHEDIARHAGSAAAPKVRVMTLVFDDGPGFWSAHIKMPAARQMSDGASKFLVIGCELHPDTGAALTWRPLTSPFNTAPTHWADKTTPLSDLVIPGWKDVVQVCLDGHACFPRLGMIGWDVLVTPDGPRIVEANANPLPLIQVFRGEGLRLPKHDAMYQRARAAADRAWAKATPEERATRIH